MIEYWPWWLGAIGLAVLALVFQFFLGRPLGVSGSWQRIARWREFRKIEKAEARFADADDDMDDAFLQATLEAFGSTADGDALPDAGTQPATPTKAERSVGTVSLSNGAHLVFLASMVIGAFATSWYMGLFRIQYHLGELHLALSGGEVQSWVVLLLGGILIGFGTQMSGGCTSGHGLSGCARFSPASIVATAFFFGTAIVLTSLTAYLVGV